MMPPQVSDLWAGNAADYFPSTTCGTEEAT